MSDLTEIKGLVEDVNKALVPLRNEIDEIKGNMPKDVVTEEKHNRMSAEITAKMQAIQDAQAKMQAVMDRPGGNGEGGEDPEQKAKFEDFLRKGYDLSGRQQGKLTLEVRAMSTDVNPDGGYLVRPEFVNKVVSRVFETSPMRQVADVITGSAKSIEMLIDDDEAVVRGVGEGASGGETGTPDVAMKSIMAHKIEAAPKMTSEMIEDAYFNVEEWLSGKVTRKIARTENTRFVNGSGVNQPRGFLTYAAWASAGVYEQGKIEQVNLGAAAALTSDGLIGLQSALVEDYQPGATWLMHRATFGKALQLKGADQYFFSPVLMRDGQAQMQMLGKPVVFMSDMPLVGANNLAVAYGDFSVGYTIYDRQGIVVLRDPFSSHGFVTYYTTKRTGGDVTSFDAIKIGKIAS